MASRAKIEHLSFFPLEEILPLLQRKKNTIVLNIQGKNIRVRAKVPRLRLFIRDRKCACCGIEGNLFAVDTIITKKGMQATPPYLNLYCHEPEKGNNYVMMTLDHIIPKSMGGRQVPSNTQAMCINCNQKKKNNFTQTDVKTLASTKQGRNYLKNHLKNPNNILVIQ